VPYILVTLNYRCPKGHRNRVCRIYHESTQDAAKAKAKGDDLMCYSCSPHSIMSRLPVEVMSFGIPEEQFKALSVEIGSDFSPERIR
jgi:hypothetical protein